MPDDPKLIGGSVTFEQAIEIVEHYHHGSIASFRILYRDAEGLGGEVKWDGEHAEILQPRDSMN